jgi:hypothetical protein
LSDADALATSLGQVEPSGATESLPAAETGWMPPVLSMPVRQAKQQSNFDTNNVIGNPVVQQCVRRVSSTARRIAVKACITRASGNRECPL